jgi:hypothetical protein
VGETRVDIHHLLEDLRDAYAGPIEETILTEVVANSLDSGARRISFWIDTAEAALTAVDDGHGMKRRDLARYHDIAASTKVRGEGIGFAGVGIKLGLLAARQVITESRQPKSHVATEWALSSRRRAPWKWIDPPGLVTGTGTAVRLELQNPLSPLLDASYVRNVLQEHFGPLLDSSFEGILTPFYPGGIRFEVEGESVDSTSDAPEREARLDIRLPRKRKPSATGWLRLSGSPLPERARGLAISTRGKVIRSGWEWLGVTPPLPDRTHGLIEAPALAACLTLNKSDFLHSGPHRATYLLYRKLIQEAVAAPLAEWGGVDSVPDDANRRLTRPVERDLEGLLEELAEDYPLLGSLVERRQGGQKRLPIGRRAVEDGAALLFEHVGGRTGGEAGAASPGPPAPPELPAPPDSPTPSDAAPHPPQGRAEGPAEPGPRKPQKLGLAIRIEARPDDGELSRLVESTVTINSAHPAYRRAEAARAEGYHLALSVAMALAPLAVEPAEAHGFVTTFLARWGELLEGGRRKPAPRPRRRGARQA